MLWYRRTHTKLKDIKNVLDAKAGDKQYKGHYSILAEEERIRQDR